MDSNGKISFRISTSGIMQITSREYPNGAWEKWQYDDLGNQTYYESSWGDFDRREYDNVGNAVYIENNADGVALDKRNKSKYYGENALCPSIVSEVQTNHDSVKREYSDGTRVKFTFDDNGYCEKTVSNKDGYVTYYQNGNWDWNYYERDDRNNEIRHETSGHYWEESKYNERDQLIYTEFSNGRWFKYEYDANGKEIYSENDKGEWEKREYNENGDVTRYENHEGHWINYEYDENRNNTRYEDETGRVITYEYDSLGNRIGMSQKGSKSSAVRPLPDISEIEAEDYDDYEYEN